MKPLALIRAEHSNDAPLIADVISRAYANAAYSDHREHVMVERLRQSSAFIPDLSLIAFFENQVVEHILLTRAHIVDDRSAVTTLALAPFRLSLPIKALE